MERLSSTHLSRLSGVSHGFFTRAGGVSRGIYASLNCGPGSADDPGHVAANLARVAAALRVTAISTVRQVHGNTVLTLQRADRSRPEADALVSATPGVAIGVTGADCPSVLLADERAGVVGAAHAGWRGALGGVLESVLAAMHAAGATSADMCAAVGPGIQRSSYEVGDDLRDTFLRANRDNGCFFDAGEVPGKHFFDLPGYVEQRLIGLGIGAVERLDGDTLSDEQRFFSYRRARLAGEPDYGRQLAVIALA